MKPTQSATTAGRARVVIVGGGYTGAAAAVQLANAAGDAVSITIVEPREELGRGMAYSTRDPDHRLNGPLDNHLLDPAQVDGLREWCNQQGVLAGDRDAKAANGGTYVRRGDFGRFVSAAVHAVQSRKGAQVRHHRALALGLEPATQATEIIAADGARIAADLVIVATGNGLPRLPGVLSSLAGDPRIIANPFDAPALEALPPRSRILLLGSGLTAMDAAATLLRQGRRHRIEMLSRHGLRPSTHRDRVSDGSPLALLDRIEGPVPGYARDALATARVRELSRALRQRIASAGAQGIDWREAFDELRNVVWQVWPGLPAVEKRRFLRHLRIHYDTYRFRVPPQTRAIVERAEASDDVVFRSGRVFAIEANGKSIRMRWKDRATEHEAAEDYDAIVNCTGLSPDCGARSNPFLASLLAAGLLQQDDCGFGFSVDGECRPFARDGTVAPRMRIVGPPSAGSQGDPLGVIFIAAQVRRIIPGVLKELGLTRKPPASASPPPGKTPAPSGSPHRAASKPSP